MTAVSSIVLDTKVLDKMTVELKPKVQRRIAKSAFRVESKAKQGSPHKTGAHRASGYTIAPGKDTSSAAANQASVLNPDARVGKPVKPKNDMSATIGFLMEYSLYLELGTTSKEGGVRMPARPHLVPAMDSEEKPLIADIKAMFK